MAEQTPPYNYSPITERPFDLPDGNRVAFWVIPNIEYYKLDVPYPTDTSDYVPKSSSSPGVTTGPVSASGG